MQKQLIGFLKNIKAFLKVKFRETDSKWPYLITGAIAFTTIIVITVLFIKLTRSMMSDVLEGYDTKISETIWSYRSPFLTDYLMAVTEIGDVWGYVIVFSSTIIFFLFVFKSWKYIGQLTFVLVLALSSNILLKQAINRSRPSGEHMVTVETLSYPSGHAMLSIAFYGFLIYLLYQFRLNKVIKFFSITILGILILSIGISRIYLGVHYPSDVLGGYMAGLIWLVLCVLIFDLIEIFRRDPET